MHPPDRPPRGVTVDPEQPTWHRYQGRLVCYSAPAHHWFYKKTLEQKAAYLTEEDFLEEEEQQPEPDPHPFSFKKAEGSDDGSDNLYTPMSTSAPTTPTLASWEVKVWVPSSFNEERTKSTKFLQEVNLYLRVNQAIYDTDEKKIIFALSFMTEGTASVWALTWGDKVNMGTWVDFKRELLS